MGHPMTTVTSGVERAARALFIRHQTEHEGASLEWATGYWDASANEPHKGDCPWAERQGPITCDRCVCDEYRFKARVVIEEMQNV